MRFIVAWANVISENMALKLSLGCLVLVLASLSTVVVKLAARKPLVVERGCLSRVVPTGDGTRTAVEVETFVREAVSMRFDTAALVKPDYLSDGEIKFAPKNSRNSKSATFPSGSWSTRSR